MSKWYPLSKAEKIEFDESYGAKNFSRKTIRQKKRKKYIDKRRDLCLALITKEDNEET